MKKRSTSMLPASDELNRFSIAVPASLFDPFNQLVKKKGYSNRSEAFRDLMRDALIQQITASPTTEVVGTLTLIYDHHVRQLNDRIAGMQHSHFHQIVSTVHVHLDHDNCLEVVILRGKASDVRRIADSLIATKGVRHGKLTITTSRAA